eukprot:364060-Chlamydomonas_euryale.AAC.5
MCTPGGSRPRRQPAPHGQSMQWSARAVHAMVREGSPCNGPRGEHASSSPRGAVHAMVREGSTHACTHTHV